MTQLIYEPLGHVTHDVITAGNERQHVLSPLLCHDGDCKQAAWSLELATGTIEEHAAQHAAGGEDSESTQHAAVRGERNVRIQSTAVRGQMQ
jgi:hypothetical protein